MLSRENEYFDNMLKIGEAYDIIKKAHEEKKIRILEEYGWDSEELKAWYEEKEKMTYPVPQGACKAYRAWNRSIELDNEELELDDEDLPF